MKTEGIGYKTRFKHCDDRFYPYLDKIVNRLPEKVKRTVLHDQSFQIVSCGAWGRYYQFDSPIKHLAYIDESILKEPEFQIIHTIAHEIAHWIGRKRKTGLWEKEAEDLLIKWGFEKEVEKAQYWRPICESEGYKIGYEWAKKHEDDLSEYEEFFDEWNEGRLSAERLDRLDEAVDLKSILYEMGLLEQEQTEDINEGSTIHDDYSMENGISGGIMGFMKEKKQRIGYEYPEKDARKTDFLELLKRINNDFSKLFALLPCLDYAKTTTITKKCSRCGKQNDLFLNDAYLVAIDTFERVKEDLEKQRRKSRKK